MKDAKLTKEQQELADLQAQKVAETNQPSTEDLLAEIERLKAKNEDLAKQQLKPTPSVFEPQVKEPIVPIAKKSTFPGNIIVLKMMRDEHKSPTGYEEIEVPEELAHIQLALPTGQRSPSYRDICYTTQADPRFLK